MIRFWADSSRRARGELRGVERALEVHPDHVVPLLLGHVEDHPVPQDARRVDQDVEPPELAERGLDQALGRRVIGHVGAVGDRAAAAPGDLARDLPRGPGVRA
jgi:hypothetical protein